MQKIRQDWIHLGSFSMDSGAPRQNLLIAQFFNSQTIKAQRKSLSSITPSRNLQPYLSMIMVKALFVLLCSYPV